MPEQRSYINPNNPNEFYSPLAYDIDSIIIINHKGDEVDIQNIITDFSITESIYNSSLTFRANIKDDSDFFNEYALNGEEKIVVTLSAGTKFGDSKTSLQRAQTFYVTEYPGYARSRSHQTTQAFSVTAVSKHAFVSKFKLISRAVDGLTSDEIKKIIGNDVGNIYVPTFGEWTDSSQSFKGIIPYMHPLDAAAWLLRRTYDRHELPFFLYETFDSSAAGENNIFLKSLRDLVGDSEVYETYNSKLLFEAPEPGPEEYKEKKQRILDFSTSFNLSKIYPGSNGAFASINSYLDISNKTIDERSFKYEFRRQPKVTLENFSLLSNSELKDTLGDKITELPAAREYIPTNKYAYSVSGENSPNYHMLSGDSNLAKIKSYEENLDSFICDLTIAGDLGLSPGKIIELWLVKPKLLKPDDTDRKDIGLSGKYLVTSIIHTFDSEYHCKIRVKRDSLIRDINKVKKL